MRNIVYRPVKDSPLYERCNPKPKTYNDYLRALSGGVASSGQWSTWQSVGAATMGAGQAMGQLYTATSNPGAWSTGRAYRPGDTVSMHASGTSPGLRYVSTVPPNPIIGDTYYDAGTGESYTWDGFAWMHLGARPPVVHTVDNVPMNEVWVLPNELTADVDLDDAQCDLINGVSREYVERQLNERSPD